MYHPYFRGKQYELITVRETAQILSASHFVPIIEPVKESLGGLERTLKAVCDANGQAIVIINPHHGVHSEDGQSISTMVKDSFCDNPKIMVGILLGEDMLIEDVKAYCDEHDGQEVALIHAGFTDANGLVGKLGGKIGDMRHIFFEKYCKKLYRKHFVGSKRILLYDGFVRRRNKDHPALEFFSDLHVTYEEDGMDGFGDFLIVGDDYSESGGPAYAVAIHLTFIDPTKENQMYIYHFVSDSQDTPTDPAGKFGEALNLMMGKLLEPNNHIFQSTAVAEFRDLHESGHFPGLGYLKKLSLKHHIETLKDFLG